MFDALIHDIVGPLARRVGTAAGSLLSGLGLASDDISAVQAGIIAAIGIGVDLALIYARNRGRK